MLCSHHNKIFSKGVNQTIFGCFISGVVGRTDRETEGQRGCLEVHSSVAAEQD